MAPYSPKDAIIGLDEEDFGPCDVGQWMHLYIEEKLWMIREVEETRRRT